MSLDSAQDQHLDKRAVRVERTFTRFSLGQRWEHWLLLLSVLVLLFTGLPQRYRAAEWSQYLLSSPERLDLVRQIHHLAALVLIAEVIYHLVHNIALLFRRRLAGDIFPVWGDFHDAWQMLKYLLFLTKEKPSFEKFSFEQKFTYWFLFFTLGAMVVSGLILWFPIVVTSILPGGVVPAAKLSHSTEAVVIAIFILVWHFFHVLILRLNLSIFTGRLSEKEMRSYHAAEYEGILNAAASPDQIEEPGVNGPQ